MNKLCTKCSISKDISNFRLNSKSADGHSCWCKSCFSIYDNNNRKIISKRKAKYYLNNKNKIKSRNSSWYDNNKERNSKRAHKYYVINKNKILKSNISYKKYKRKTDSSFKLLSNIRNRIGLALKSNSKSAKTISLLGCSINEAKNHLQQTAIKNGYLQFDINDYSGKEYNIDHIIPCSVFNLSCSYHQKLCFNYSNLQILTAKENLSKSDSVL